MESVTIRIREKHQFTGAGEHVVIFEALIVPIPDDTIVEVELVSLPPICDDVDDEWLVELALNRIRDGVRTILGPMGAGATVRISDLYIHPVDFSDRMFEIYTIRSLVKALMEVRVPQEWLKEPRDITEVDAAIGLQEARIRHLQQYAKRSKPPEESAIYLEGLRQIRAHFRQGDELWWWAVYFNDRCVDGELSLKAGYVILRDGQEVCRVEAI